MITEFNYLICDSNKCTGCGACVNNCPRNAIVMKRDNYGFEHPYIDSKKCNSCNVCRSVCPEHEKPQFSQPLKVYAAYAQKDTLRNNSTSGGIARVISEYIMQSNGEVYSHLFSKDLDLECKRIESKKDLDRCNGSKYVQSSMGRSIKCIIEDLDFKKKVLFIGTPCQVAGLEKSVKNDIRSNLITVSFVCGGVPSNVFLKDYLSTIGVDSNIEDLKFRRNNEYGLFGIKNSIMNRLVERWECEYLIGFDEHVIQRESCYRCQYSRVERVGDITIGDFWGIDSIPTCAQHVEAGVSLCIISSEAGDALIKELQKKNMIWIEEHPLEQVIQENPRLVLTLDRKKEVDIFRELYTQQGLVSAVENLYGKKYRLLRAKRVLKKNPVLKRIINMVKRHE